MGRWSSQDRPEKTRVVSSYQRHQPLNLDTSHNYQWYVEQSLGLLLLHFALDNLLYHWEIIHKINELIARLCAEFITSILIGDCQKEIEKKRNCETCCCDCQWLVNCNNPLDAPLRRLLSGVGRPTKTCDSIKLIRQLASILLTALSLRLVLQIILLLIVMTPAFGHVFLTGSLPVYLSGRVLCLLFKRNHNLSPIHSMDYAQCNTRWLSPAISRLSLQLGISCFLDFRWPHIYDYNYNYCPLNSITTVEPSNRVIIRLSAAEFGSLLTQLTKSCANL